VAPTAARVTTGMLGRAGCGLRMLDIFGRCQAGSDTFGMRRPVTSTGTNLLRLVKHLAFSEAKRSEEAARLVRGVTTS